MRFRVDAFCSLLLLLLALGAALGDAQARAFVLLPAVCYPTSWTITSVAVAESNPDPRPGGPEKASAYQDVWTHDQQVIANLKARPPATPVVCLLGGSSARECTISDERWAAQVRALGTKARTYNLGSSNRTFAESLALIRALPGGRLHMIVFIGVSPGSFGRRVTSASITLPAPTFPLPPWRQHVVSQDRILSLQAKRALVSRWMAEVYPVFQSQYSTQSMLLERLITVCKSRDLHPILVEVPRNMAIIGHAMDRPISRVRRTCRALSAEYSIPFLGGFVGAANLANLDFYDTSHIVEPGRVKWQRLLSRETARQLRHYGLGVPASSVAQ